jgi:glycosyltransferase involved in cell wall biosynthesis
MTTLPKISFIIPLFNHLAETEKMLASLLTSLPVGLPHEIILVDDGSTDGTREWLKAIQDARIRVHLNERNLGYAATNNVGWGWQVVNFYVYLTTICCLSQDGWNPCWRYFKLLN